MPPPTTAAATVPGPRPRLVRMYELVAVVGLAAFATNAAAGGGNAAVDRFFDDWVYYGLLVLATGCSAYRVVRDERDRLPWALVTLGIASWTVGDLLFTFAYGNDPPLPSAADGFYLAFYPACYAAMLLLVRAHLFEFNRAFWLDGLTAALAAAALGAAVLVQAVLETTHGSRAEVAVNLAYPIGDVLLLSLVVAVLAASGWRPGRSWIVLGAGLATGAVADGIYLFQAATDTYTVGEVLDTLWPASMVLLAWAAWQPPLRRQRRLVTRPLLATPLVCGLIGVGLLVADRFHSLNGLALACAGGTIAAVFVRLAATIRENRTMLERLRQQTLTDTLTGLGNRRRLMADLDDVLAAGLEAPARVLVILDLDGFKQYNDTFGHPAGDVLLSRLGRKLAEATAPIGTAYRPGGDEFCVLTKPGSDDAEGIASVARAALAEEGDGFAITSSHGAVLVPGEATDASEALRIADERLYARKSSARLRLHRPHDVLLQALLEREPELHDHSQAVASLAVAVGRELGLSDEQLGELRLAALLHDVGKLAIPDAILRKPGALSEEEWAFVEQHTLIGQRIVGAAPALQAVGRIVRASHERWDGTGYPDALEGEEIPLGARIVFACDTYASVTSERVYREASPTGEALEELRRAAGTQLDPGVVAALVRVVGRGEPAADATAAA